MNKVKQAIRRIQGRDVALLRDTRGLSTVEYVIILVVVAVWESLSLSSKPESR